MAPRALRTLLADVLLPGGRLTRVPDPALVATVRAVLEQRAGETITGRELLAEVRARGIVVREIRRVQEAVQHLLVVEQLPIASTSSRPAGYRLGSADELRASIREIDARVVGTFTRRKALKAALAAVEGRTSPQLQLSHRRPSVTLTTIAGDEISVLVDRASADVHAAQLQALDRANQAGLAAARRRSRG